jgi:hypothetical protein
MKFKEKGSKSIYMMIHTRGCESEKKKYFELYTMEPEFYDINTGQLQQIDAFFYNKNI